MSDVMTSVDVRVPVRTAYNQWTQFESFPEFMSGVVAVRQLDDRRTHWVTEIAGAHREFDAEIVEQLPDERIAWRSMDGDVRHSGVVTFQTIAGGQTRVTVDLEWEPTGLLEKAGGAIGVDRLQVKADLERFRRFIEARGTETGQWRGTIARPGQADTEPTAAGTEATSDPQRRQSGDVVDILIAQHHQLKDLMARTADAKGEQKQHLFTELMGLLKTHEKGEQRVVHPVTRSSVPDGVETADARLGEEQRADLLLTEVDDLAANTHEFDIWFERLQQAVLAHAEHEEGEEFPKLRRELAPERLQMMGEELVAVQNAGS